MATPERVTYVARYYQKPSVISDIQKLCDCIIETNQRIDSPSRNLLGSFYDMINSIADKRCIGYCCFVLILFNK